MNTKIETKLSGTVARREELQKQLDQVAAQMVAEREQVGEKVLAGSSPGQMSKSIHELEGRSEALTAAIAAADKAIKEMEGDLAEVKRTEALRKLKLLNEQAEAETINFLQSVADTHRLGYEAGELVSSIFRLASEHNIPLGDQHAATILNSLISVHMAERIVFLEGVKSAYPDLAAGLELPAGIA